MTSAGQVLIYDAQGKRVKSLSLPEGAEVVQSSGGLGSGKPSSTAGPSNSGEAKGRDDDDSDEDSKAVGAGRGRKEPERRKGRVISVDWYDGAEGLLHQQVPTLCLALEGGTVQMSRGIDDPDPVVVNANMGVRQASFCDTEAFLWAVDHTGRWRSSCNNSC